MVVFAGLFLLLIGHIVFWAVVPILAALACRWLPFLARWRPRSLRILLGGLAGYLAAFLSAVLPIFLLRFGIPNAPLRDDSTDDLKGMLALPPVLVGIGMGIPALTVAGMILGLFIRPRNSPPDRRP